MTVQQPGGGHGEEQGQNSVELVKERLGRELPGQASPRKKLHDNTSQEQPHNERQKPTNVQYDLWGYIQKHIRGADLRATWEIFK